MGPNVLLSGAVLSFMLSENVKSDGVTEGFLIGEVEKITTQNITDTQICLENTHCMASVTGYLPCSSLQSFYMGSGHLKIANLMELLGDNFSKVIGWYRCRGSCLTTYLREIHIHQQLSKLMTHANEHFILALFSSPKNSLEGTMGTSYKFYVMKDRNLVGVSHQIANMGETSSATYYKDAPNTHLYASRSLEESLKSIENLEPGVQDIQTLYNKLLTQLKELLPEYSTVCEERSKSIEELLRLKFECYTLGLTPNYIPESSEEKEICDKQILHKAELQDVNLILKEVIPKSKADGRKSSDKTKKASSAIFKSRTLTNGEVNDTTTKNKRELKLSKSSTRSTSQAGRKCASFDPSECRNAGIKNASDSPTKSRLKQRPQSSSPSKAIKQMSCSPEF